MQISRTNGRAAPRAAALAMAALLGLAACGPSEPPAPAEAPAAAPEPAAYEIGPLVVGDPWARPAAAGMNSAGYFAVVNTSAAEDDRLLAVETDAAARTEIHRTVVQGEIMSMAPVEGGLPLPAGERVTLGPGGLHVMLLDLTRPLKAGETVAATLVFEKAGRLKTAFAVRSGMDEAHGGH